MEENKNNLGETKKKSWLQKIDDAAAAKGSVVKTLWQIAKFSVISSIATVIQLVLVNLLYIWMKEWKAQLPSFLETIFDPKVVGDGNDNWGYVMPFFLSNAIANVFAYFLNKKKTFRSDAPMWHFIVYIGLIVVLILVMTWFQGVMVSWMKGSPVENLAPTFASLTAGLIQAIVLFPLQKFVLSRERKNKEELQP